MIEFIMAHALAFILIYMFIAVIVFFDVSLLFQISLLKQIVFSILWLPLFIIAGIELVLIKIIKEI